MQCQKRCFVCADDIVNLEKVEHIRKPVKYDYITKKFTFSSMLFCSFACLKRDVVINKHRERDVASMLSLYMLSIGNNPSEVHIAPDPRLLACFHRDGGGEEGSIMSREDYKKKINASVHIEVAKKVTKQTVYEFPKSEVVDDAKKEYNKEEYSIEFNNEQEVKNNKSTIEEKKSGRSSSMTSEDDDDDDQDDDDGENNDDDEDDNEYDNDEGDDDDEGDEDAIDELMCDIVNEESYVSNDPEASAMLEKLLIDEDQRLKKKQKKWNKLFFFIYK